MIIHLSPKEFISQTLFDVGVERVDGVTGKRPFFCKCGHNNIIGQLGIGYNNEIFLLRLLLDL